MQSAHDNDLSFAVSAKASLNQRLPFYSPADSNSLFFCASAKLTFMKTLSLIIKDSDGNVLASETAENSVNMVFSGEYQPGTTITFCAPLGTFAFIKLDDVLDESFVYMGGDEYTLTIPFGEKKFSYNPKTFEGTLHLLSARVAEDPAVKVYKNLALNAHDTAANSTCFPHAFANIETRGESVFAARNAINGNTENRSHGNWPYESWGINRDPSAALTLDFGRPVTVDRLVLVTRADFPHDNYWTNADIIFSDGSVMPLTMQKSVAPHQWSFEPKTITGLTLCNLIKDESDPSPFPALTQIQVWGTEAV